MLVTLLPRNVFLVLTSFSFSPTPFEVSIDNKNIDYCLVYTSFAKYKCNDSSKTYLKGDTMS